MRRVLVIFMALASLSLAQYESRLLVGFQETQAIYPGGGAVAFGPAKLVADALGLGYLEASGKVYLSLGSRVAAFNITRSGGDAAQLRNAYRSNGNIWIPVRELAKNLGLYYRNDYGASVLALQPARLTGIKKVAAGGIERYVMVFDRDVSARLVANNPPKLALIGVSDVPDPLALADLQISINKTDWGYELMLPKLGGSARLLFIPNQVVVESGSIAQSPLVVLDAGHGGSDTGVVVDKLSEKDLAMSIVNRLAKLLKEGGLEVALTRSADNAVPLAARAQYATGAQVFVSVHAAAGNKVAVYSHPEIQTLRFLEKGRELSAKTPANQKAILQRYIAAPGSAARFAQGVSQAFAGAGIVATSSQDAMFVLSQTGGVAIMIEMGFEQLRTSQGRDQAAKTLAGAIFSYLGLPQGSKPSIANPPGPAGNQP